MILRATLAALMAAAIASSPLAAAAAGVSADVAVVDDRGEPVSGAEIVSSKQAAVLGVTGADGHALVSADDGTPVLARWKDRRSDNVALRAPAITITLLAKIGSIKARIPVTTTAGPVSRLSAAAVLGGSLTTALRFDPQYRSGVEGGSSAIEVNGVPLTLPSSAGGGGPSKALAELFDSYSPEDANGSTIPNFHLVNPTASPQQTIGIATGSFADTALRGSAAGRAGRFGYGISAIGDANAGVLGGRTFTDLSGQRYEHSSDDRTVGATANILYDLGSTQLGGSVVATRERWNDIASVQPGPVPAGYGPGASSTSSAVTEWLTLDHTAGRDHLFAVAVGFNGGGVDDHRAATFLGAPAAYATAYSYKGAYDFAKVSRTFGNLSVFAQGTLQTFTLDNAGYAGSAAGTSLADAFEVGFERGGRGVTGGGRIGVANAAGGLSGSQPTANLHVEFGPASSHVRLAYNRTQSQIQESFGVKDQVLAAPQSASIDCGGGTAVVGAPAVTGSAHPVKSTFEGSLALEPRQDTLVTIGGYVGSERNAFVQGVAEGPLPVSAGYLAALGPIFAATCPGRELSASSLYGSRYVQAGDVRSREAFVSARRRIGHATLSGFYEVLSKSASSAHVNGLVTSSIVPGAQLPFVPLHRANLQLSYETPKLVWGIDGLYTSANNAANLPGHVELLAGVGVGLGHGILTLSVDNPFASFGGTFASSRYAVPIQTTTGPFNVLATPLSSSWTLKYTLGVDRPSH